MYTLTQWRYTEGIRDAHRPKIKDCFTYDDGTPSVSRYGARNSSVPLQLPAPSTKTTLGVSASGVYATKRGRLDFCPPSFNSEGKFL